MSVFFVQKKRRRKERQEPDKNIMDIRLGGRIPVVFFGVTEKMMINLPM